MRSGPSRPAKRSFRRRRPRRFPRAPDCPRLPRCANVCGKPVSTRRANFASTRLVMPGARFCSCTISGMPARRAASPPGPAANPPKLTTARGWRSRSVWRAALTALSSLNGAANSVARPFPRTPRTCDGVDWEYRAAAPDAFPCRLRCPATAPARRARAAPWPRPGPGRCARPCRRRGSSPDAGRNRWRRSDGFMPVLPRNARRRVRHAGAGGWCRATRSTWP